ncbi:MAG: redox-regulated ATPase YchF [Chloroflexi bacterium]|nr:redox-regulated ATPase YchF [Chloroflexota bacterium]
MSVDIGIVGLPQSGRSTIFRALTGSGYQAQESLTGKAVAHVGIARVPEPRLQGLADILHPQKIVPATARYTDIGVSVKDLAAGKGGGSAQAGLLSQLSNVDAIINVVRAFRDDSIPHIEGSLDVARDITNMGLELIFSDLKMLERRLERLAESLKGARASERQGLLREEELLLRIKKNLENETPVRSMALIAEESKAIAGFQFLTAKPLLIVVNIGEEELPQAASIEAELIPKYSRQGSHAVAVCGKVEMELAQMTENEARALHAEFGIVECGADRIIRSSYELLGLITFFTIASGEVRAWAIPRGTEAVRAAGKIHSDMERGFIRAEVISYDNLAECGSLAQAKKKGLLRLEGKSYVMQDGDVVTFLFNV